MERVGLALAAHYPGAPNGRVRDLPDRRAIRWYTTTGLVDRPSAMRGRTALYGPRHLLQLVAVKRRQAAGHTLADIQTELAGASDATLAALARVPADLLTDTRPPQRDGAGTPQRDEDRAAPVRARFWAAPRVASADGGAAPPPSADADPPTTAVALSGVALGGGVVLLVPAPPDAQDCVAIAAAAAPLLALLAERGLLAPDPPSAIHTAVPDDRRSSPHAPLTDGSAR